MEIIQRGRADTNASSRKPSRIPLLSQISNSKAPALTQPRKVRRKTSSIYRIDSSEDYPSSHESIYHAECFSNTGSDDDGHPLETWRLITPSSVTGPTANQDENRHFVTPAVSNTPNFFGRGTALATIVEQKSTTTMGTKVSSIHPMSTSETSLPSMSTPNLLGHRDSFELPATVILRPPRRRKSFSADDLVLIKRSYHDARLMIESTAGRPLRVHDFYAEPQAPIMPAFERPSTPPGMPSWTAAQNGSLPQLVPIRAPQNRMKRFLGIQSRPVLPSSYIPLTTGAQQRARSNQRIRSVQYRPGQTRSRVPPRFRPQRSGHGVGNLEAHPFIRSLHTVPKSEPTPAVAEIPTADSHPNFSIRPQNNISTAARNTRTLNMRSLFIAHRDRATTPSYPQTTLASPGSHTTTGTRPIQCPHRRGRHAVIRTLNQSASQVPLARYHPIPHSPTQNATAPQMSGAIPSPSPTALPPATPRPLSHQCWKCRLSTVVTRIDDMWEASSNWCCWVFCGVEADDGEGAELSGGGRNGSRSRETLVGPRRVLLDGVPVVVF